MLAILAGMLIGALVQGTVVHDDCKKLNFEPKACKVSEVLEKGK